MHIVADENIPFAREAFSTIGEITLVHGRSLPPLDDCDALIVRSITKVNGDLLDGTPVSFVGTATIGFDHIDRAYLERRGIGFSSAPGSNSNSVAEYVVAALLEYAGTKDITLAGTSIGVVGVGNVGSKVAAKCRALGMSVLLNDPPRAEESGDPSFLPLDDLPGADFLTFHVPLTKDGPHPTWHLASDSLLSSMNGVLLNTSRGSVVDEAALHRHLGGSVRDAILDVWEHEPDVDRSLAVKVFGGTPHIAGYSFDGKVNGTQMMYDAVCAHFGIDPVWNAADSMPPGGTVACADGDVEDVLRDAVRQVYDIRRDFAAFAERMDAFDRLRKEYPIRREFGTAAFSTEVPPAAGDTLEGIGFTV